MISDNMMTNTIIIQYDAARLMFVTHLVMHTTTEYWYPIITVLAYSFHTYN